ncbi:acyltransferase [Okibacterium fritillariae]|nr:acyltransferase [Okibacterium fritillariae]
MHFVVIGAETRIEIGEDVQISEFSSVRDANHVIDSPVVIAKSGMKSSAISIGNDVWVGRGSAVLSGAKIESGAVVGANSVVNKGVDSDSIVAGAPARLLRKRQNR